MYGLGVGGSDDKGLGQKNEAILRPIFKIQFCLEMVFLTAQHLEHFWRKLLQLLLFACSPSKVLQDYWSMLNKISENNNSVTFCISTKRCFCQFKHIVGCFIFTVMKLIRRNDTFSSFSEHQFCCKLFKQFTLEVVFNNRYGFRYMHN